VERAGDGRELGRLEASATRPAKTNLVARNAGNQVADCAFVGASRRNSLQLGS